MTSSVRMGLAFGLASLCAAPVCAQFSEFADGFFIGGERLLGNKGVQQELKLDGEQSAKRTTLIQEFEAKTHEENRRNRDLPPEESLRKFLRLYRALTPELHRNVAGILRPEQRKRFSEIQIQQLGTGVFLIPYVQDLLKLSYEQRMKLKEVHSKTIEASKTIATNTAKMGGDYDKAREQTAELAKEGVEEARSLLTDSQKSTFDQLAGKPFKYEREPPSR